MVFYMQNNLLLGVSTENDHSQLPLKLQIAKVDTTTQAVQVLRFGPLATEINVT